ncbi:hypothetical protein KFU94_24515 [Chloroflexi bacterium TSY]|nr:hypothetical protein [Chloroflexi bacterium TSY]
MLRNILAVFVGFILWTLLWLSGNALLRFLSPAAFHPDGTTENFAILLTILGLSILCSIVAGVITASLVYNMRMQIVLILAFIQLGVGIFVQSKYWDSLPLWYHLMFLTMLAPSILFGGWWRARLANK